MKIWQLTVLLIGVALPASAGSNAVKKNNGIVDLPSNHSVDETVERIQNILQTKGITLFALIDHSGEAEKVGMICHKTWFRTLRSSECWQPKPRSSSRSGCVRLIGLNVQREDNNAGS